MSADIVTDYVYSSHCSDCFVFGPQSATEEEAVAWADSHDSENHAQCGGGWLCNASHHIEGCLSGDTTTREDEA